MNRVGLSVFVFGIYSCIMGFVLLFVPNTVLPWFNLPALGEPWVNLLGFVLICSGYYYLRFSRTGSLDFATASIHTRFVAPFIVVYLISRGIADWHFLSFAIIDFSGGLWTLVELRNLKKTGT